MIVYQDHRDRPLLQGHFKQQANIHYGMGDTPYREPCLVIMDSVIRIKEGVIKKESFETDSFYNGLLGFPQYTRPVEIDGYSVPEVLRSGNHAKIDEYRQFHSIEKTMKNRMDLFEKKLAEDEEFLKLCEK